MIPQPVCLDVFDADKAARIRAGREQQGIVFGHVAAWLRLRGDSRHGNALYDIDHLLDLWTDVRLKVPGQSALADGRTESSCASPLRSAR